jgi:hypothetical protein
MDVSSTLFVIFILKNHKEKNKYSALCSDICYGNQLRNNCLYLQEMDSMLCKIAKRALQTHVYAITSGRLTEISFSGHIMVGFRCSRIPHSSKCCMWPALSSTVISDILTHAIVWIVQANGIILSSTGLEYQIWLLIKSVLPVVCQI